MTGHAVSAGHENHFHVKELDAEEAYAVYVVAEDVTGKFLSEIEFAVQFTTPAWPLEIKITAAGTTETEMDETFNRATCRQMWVEAREGRVGCWEDLAREWDEGFNAQFCTLGWQPEYPKAFIAVAAEELAVLQTYVCEHVTGAALVAMVRTAEGRKNAPKVMRDDWDLSHWESVEGSGKTGLSFLCRRQFTPPFEVLEAIFTERAEEAAREAAEEAAAKAAIAKARGEGAGEGAGGGGGTTDDFDSSDDDGEKGPMLTIERLNTRLKNKEIKLTLRGVLNADKVETLRLVGCKLEARGLKELAQYLNQARNLKHLTIGNDFLVRGKMLSIDKDIKSANYGRRIYEDDFRGIKEFANKLSACVRLETLNVQKASLGLSGIKFLAAGARRSASLRTLNVAANQIKAAGAPYLNMMLLETRMPLTTLILRHNHLKRAGAVMIVAAVRHVPLRILDLHDNKLQGVDVEDLCLVFKTNTTLTDIDLSNNPAKSLGARALANVLEHNDTLQVRHTET